MWDETFSHVNPMQGHKKKQQKLRKLEELPKTDKSIALLSSPQNYLKAHNGSALAEREPRWERYPKISWLLSAMVWQQDQEQHPWSCSRNDWTWNLMHWFIWKGGDLSNVGLNLKSSPPERFCDYTVMQMLQWYIEVK